MTKRPSTPPQRSLAQIRRDNKAKAYRKLVNALRDPMVVYALGYVAEGAGDGGDHTAKDGDSALRAKRRIENLLRELEEDK